MRLTACLLALGAGIVLATAMPASADAPHDMTNDFHHPLDLQATNPPGPNVAVDETGDHLVHPGTVLDQARLQDPDEVKWPTFDKSVWERVKSQYQIVPR
jgi:hypothetical protein